MSADEPSSYRDRNDGYVPTPLPHSDLAPNFNTVIGNPHDDHHVTTIVPVVIAQADEMNRGGDRWWWAQVDPGSADGTKEHWSHFEGWDVRIGVDIRTWNGRNVNDWKGRDEIRRERYWTLSFNEQVVCGGYVSSDVLETLLTIRRTIGQLRALGPIDWREGNYREQIEGRKVYFRSTPATLGHWMPDQGCVMVAAVPGTSFPPAAYDIDERTGTDGNPEYNYSDEFKHEAKVDLLSPDIWWWRKRDDWGADGGTGGDSAKD